MNLQDISAHWLALHEALGIGEAIDDDAGYERALGFVESVFEDVASDPLHPLAGLVALLGERIRAYEDSRYPWPDSSTPASVLAHLMQEHGLLQSQLPEVGSQGVVSEVLAGKRPLNARQVKVLAQRFGVPADVLLG
jgi:HTH-type transcriptional regulator / antitoxin HigA